MAEDLFSEFFGDAVFCGAVAGEDVVAFGFGEGFVEEGGGVEGFAHFYVASLGADEDGLLQVGAGVGLRGLGFELGGGDGVGVKAGVVLDALGVAENAFGAGGCEAVFLTIQGGREQFQGGAEFAHETDEGDGGVGVRGFGGVGWFGRSRVGNPRSVGENSSGVADEDLEGGDVVGEVDADRIWVRLGFHDGEGVG